MTRRPPSGPRHIPDDHETGESRKERRQSGALAAVNRYLARLSEFTTTVLLTAFAVTVAVCLNWMLGLTGFFLFDRRVFLAATAITILTGAPFIYYSQHIIRELKASRRTLTQMTEKLAVAFHNAEQANDAKSKFLANMSHELRTPLNAVIGFSDIMLNQRFGPLENPRYQEYSRDINASGTHLLGIINDILDLAKIESGQATVEDESEFDAIAVIQSACKMVGPLATRRDVELRVNLPAKAIRLTAVERMVRQILINILSNALKFTPSSGLVDLRLELRANGDMAITVSDTGVGMSAEDVKVALTPFGQVHNAMSASQPGTGLGLPLAKAMMDLHEGKLAIRSQPDNGTTVVMIFPATRTSVSEQPAAIAIAIAS
jgi:signal transduction histidine kinase